jgi:LuxR family transcriptional regulator, quorum-sensing system regulator BjaR1
MNFSLDRNFVFDTIDGISRVNSLPQVSATFRDAVTKLGFTSLGINDLPRPGEGANPVILMESTPPGFRECYIEERFYLVDHICAQARAAAEPFRYSEAPFPRAQAANHRRFLQALDTFGLANGFVVPLGRPANMPACAWLAGADPILDDDAKRTVQLIALFAASMARVLSCPPDDGAGASKLSGREREVLTWAAQGKSARDIGEILRITKRTVDAHTQNAIRKLGATNRTHAVVVALRDQMIAL